MTRKKNAVDFFSDETLICHSKDFEVVEAYKTIRTNIMYSMPKTNGGKMLVLTSPTAGDGKTTTSINLALTFAQVNARVLLMDCDLRKPKIHRHLKLERKDGVSNILCGFTDVEQAIKVGVRENLDVITSGEVPPNPPELLQSEKYENLINYLKTKYDYIIVDTPPISLVTDATSPIKLSNGTVLVTRMGYTTTDALDVAIDRLEKIDAKIIGTIMIDNKENNHVTSYKKYKYGYKNYGYKD